MRIGCITRHYYPTDQEIRVTKFAKAVSGAGSAFFVFCPGRYRAPKQPQLPYAETIRFNPLLGGLLGRLIFSPIPINPLWFFWFYRTFKQTSLDAVIVRDLRLAVPAIVAGRSRGIKVVLDLGENYEGLMKLAGKQRLVHHLIRNAWLIKLLEIISVRMADQVWVVCKENRDRLSVNAPKARFTIVSNYPSVISLPADQRSLHAPYNKSGPPTQLIYFGLIDNLRGLDLAIDAFAIARQEIDNIAFSICGEGDFRPALEERTRALSLENRIHFTGWIEDERRLEILIKSDIAILLHKVSDFWQATMPNKLFDYMVAGLPVIATQLRPIMNIIEEAECGVIVEENPEAIAAAITDLALDNAKRRKFGENGIKAVRSRYTWESESKKVIAALTDLSYAHASKREGENDSVINPIP